MTPAEIKALVERLEAHMGQADLQDVLRDCREAATALRSFMDERASMQARLDRWEPKPFNPPSVSSTVDGCNKIAAALGKPYPRTCLICRLGPCLREVVPYAAPTPPAVEGEAGE